jgi:hypothetical protein
LCGEPLPRTPGEGGFPVNPPIGEVGAGHDFAASNERETGKTAEIRYDMADFCGIRGAVCATQSATTRVS